MNFLGLQRQTMVYFFIFSFIKIHHKKLQTENKPEKTHKNIKVPSTSGEDIKIMFCLKAG